MTGCYGDSAMSILGLISLFLLAHVIWQPFREFCAFVIVCRASDGFIPPGQLEQWRPQADPVFSAVVLRIPPASTMQEAVRFGARIWSPPVTHSVEMDCITASINKGKEIRPMTMNSCITQGSVHKCNVHAQLLFLSTLRLSAIEPQMYQDLKRRNGACSDFLFLHRKMNALSIKN